MVVTIHDSAANFKSVPAFFGGNALDMKKIWRGALIVAACAAGLWLFAAVLLPVLAPFLIGLAVAALVQKPVSLLLRRTQLPRGLAAFLCVLVIFGGLFAGLFFLLRAVLTELSGFLRKLPALAASLAGPLSHLEARLLELAGKLPDGIGTGLRSGIKSLFESGSVLGSRIYDWLFDFASGFFGKAPGIVLFIITSILASFMSAGDLPAIRDALRSRLPEKWRTRLEKLLTHLKVSLGGWLRAQFKLMGVMFLLVTAGLAILGVDYPLLFGLIVALVDALPVFGTGTILIPWSLTQFLQNDLRRGIGLLVLYGVAALGRQALEPRLVGKQVGLHPLLTLLALYTGFRAAGVAGMILFPIGVIFLKQLWDHAGLSGNL